MNAVRELVLAPRTTDNTMEFGVAGSRAALPTTLVGLMIGTRAVRHCVAAFCGRLQSVVDTHTVCAGSVVPLGVAVPVITLSA